MVPFAGGVVSIAASLLAVASGPGLVAATSLYLGSRKDENGINEIERQMLQDEHPAAKLYDLIASGRFSAAWNSNEPCQTGFGRAADYVCGKTYVPLKFFYQIAADTLSRSSRIGKRMLSSQPLDCSSKRYILNSNINMSFDAEMNNSKCVRHDPQIYQARVWFEGSAIKKICNIFQCARDRYSLLQELIPCDTAPKINRTFSTFLCYGDSLSFRYFDGNEIRTGMCVAYKKQRISLWQHYQIFNTLQEILYQCEQNEIVPVGPMGPKELPANVWVGIALGVTGVAGVVFAVYQTCRKKDDDLQPLLPERNVAVPFAALAGSSRIYNAIGA